MAVWFGRKCSFDSQLVHTDRDGYLAVVIDNKSTIPGTADTAGLFERDMKPIWNTLKMLEQTGAFTSVFSSVVGGVISNKSNKVVTNWTTYINSDKVFVVHKDNFKKFFGAVFANIADIQFQEMVKLQISNCVGKEA